MGGDTYCNAPRWRSSSPEPDEEEIKNNYVRLSNDPTGVCSCHCTSTSETIKKRRSILIITTVTHYMCVPHDDERVRCDIMKQEAKDREREKLETDARKDRESRDEKRQQRENKMNMVCDLVESLQLCKLHHLQGKIDMLFDGIRVTYHRGNVSLSIKDTIGECRYRMSYMRGTTKRYEFTDRRPLSYC
jgi:hypothetical protein